MRGIIFRPEGRALQAGAADALLHRVRAFGAGAHHQRDDAGARQAVAVAAAHRPRRCKRHARATARGAKAQHGRVVLRHAVAAVFRARPKAAHGPALRRAALKRRAHPGDKRIERRFVERARLRLERGAGAHHVRRPACQEAPDVERHARGRLRQRGHRSRRRADGAHARACAERRVRRAAEHLDGQARLGGRLQHERAHVERAVRDERLPRRKAAQIRRARTGERALLLHGEEHLRASRALAGKRLQDDRDAGAVVRAEGGGAVAAVALRVADHARPGRQRHRVHVRAQQRRRARARPRAQQVAARVASAGKAQRRKPFLQQMPHRLLLPGRGGDGQQLLKRIEQARLIHRCAAPPFPPPARTAGWPRPSARR